MASRRDIAENLAALLSGCFALTRVAWLFLTGAGQDYEDAYGLSAGALGAATLLATAASHSLDSKAENAIAKEALSQSLARVEVQPRCCCRLPLRSCSQAQYKRLSAQVHA